MRMAVRFAYLAAGICIISYVFNTPNLPLLKSITGSIIGACALMAFVASLEDR